QKKPGVFKPLDLGLERSGIIRAIAAAQLDGNGKMDIILARQILEKDGWHSVLEVVWDAAYPGRRAELLSSGLPLISSVVRGDVDGDGVADIVGGGGHGRIILLKGSKAASKTVHFDVEESPELGTFPYPGCNGYGIALGEVDREPGLEILASFANDRCLGNGRLEGWRVRRRPAPAPDTAADAAAPAEAPSPGAG